MNTGNFKEEVRSSNPIVDVVSEYLSLKKVGKRYKALCPFHEDTHPSFYVDDERGLFHCFGCGAGGDVFDFIQMIDSVDFKEALQKLAKRANIPIPDKLYPEKRKRIEPGPDILKCLNDASNIYKETLKKSDEQHPARKFLRDRQIEQDYFDEFDIGLTPSGWTKLKDELLKSGFDEETLESAGLIRESKKGTIDNFYNRLIFTIRKENGDVVGFGARSLDGSEPKYINTRDTELFHKGELLYGLHRAKEKIREKDRAIIVEGYMDVISLWKGGIEETIAPLGTALTEKQARLLSRFTNNIYIAFDGDDAGKKAVIRSLPALYSTNNEVKVAMLSKGDDPDEVIRREGKAGLEKLLDNSITGFEYLLEIFAEEYNRETIEGRANISEKISEVISQIKSDVKRKAIINEISKRLSIDPSVFITRSKKSHYQREKTKSLISNKEKSDGIRNYEIEFIKLILDNKDLLQKAYEEVDTKGLISSDVREIINTIFRLFSDGEDITPATLLDHLEDEEHKTIISKAVVLDINWDESKAFNDILIRLQNRSVNIRLKELIEKSREEIIDDDESADILREIKKLKSNKKRTF
jgi:DNA primase